MGRLNSILFFTGFLLLGISNTGIAQDSMEVYTRLSEQAQDEYIEKKFEAAALHFSEAFMTIGNKGYPPDRYTAAMCWAMIQNRDSAFYQLQKLADKTDYLTKVSLISETSFNSLHPDPRWEKLIRQIDPQNETYNDSLAKILEDIYDKDQEFRNRLEPFNKKYGADSKEMKSLWDTIQYYDSLNLDVVIVIIDQYGWQGKNQVGKKGNKALWLIIQHAPLEVQERYFPVMQVAVKKGKASAPDLAYLEDRILMRQGRNQIYGSQYAPDPETGKMVLWPMDDPEHVNERRDKVGLPPLKTK